LPTYGADGDPFSLGVASGALHPDGVVLWTRLAPEPLSANPATPGGMTGGDVPVAYEIATDPAIRDIVRRGVANDLRVDFDDPDAPVAATEFVGTSVSSAGPPHDAIAAVLPDNPHLRFFESRQRGYVSVGPDRRAMTTQIRVVSDATDPKASVSTLKTFVVESGRPGAVAA